MYALEIASDFGRYITTLHPKRFKQVYLKVFSLQSNPRPPDCEMVDPEIYRVWAGPYRMTYRIDDQQRRILMLIIEKKNQ